MMSSSMFAVAWKFVAIVMLAWRKRLDDANYTLAYVKDAERRHGRVVADYHESHKGQSARRADAS